MREVVGTHQGCLGQPVAIPASRHIGETRFFANARRRPDQWKKKVLNVSAAAPMATESPSASAVTTRGKGRGLERRR